MSNKQHLQDVADALPHEPAGGPAGGACLNRHEGGAPNSPNKNSCYHRWQAYEVMSGERRHYDWPLYRTLAERKAAWVRVAEAGMPRDARRWLPRPAENDWDYGKSCKRRVKGIDVELKNFYERSSAPSNHQAHHLIPNGELADTIVKLFSDIDAVVPIRRGLLKAKYNLNHDMNMLMLPMDRVVSTAIGLPLHQSCWAARSHKAWSTYVFSKLEPIFNALRTRVDQHEARDYADVRTRLENAAKALRKEVLASKAATLDDLAKAQNPGGMIFS